MTSFVWSILGRALRIRSGPAPLALMTLTAALFFGPAAPASARTLPAAGTVLPARAVHVRWKGKVDFRELAERAARRPAPVGPLVPIIRPEAEEPPEPVTEGSDIPQSNAPQEVYLPFAPSPAPGATFIGMDDIPILGTSAVIIPPDVDGAVGRTKIMEGLNNNYRIFSKTGAVLSTLAIMDFWNATGASDFYDPKMLYDPINDRWIVCVLSNPATAASAVCIGVSETSDPQGAYDLAVLDADGTDVNWADFPTLGFNKNWVAINVNMFTIGGNSPAGSECFVLDYAQMRSNVFTGTLFTGTGFASSPAATYSSTENTLYVPTHWQSSTGTYRLDTITGTPGAPVYTIGAILNRGLTWTQPPGNINILPQSAPISGTSACGATPCPIFAQDSQIRSTPVFRGGSIWYTQTVGLPAGGAITHTAVQWTKLDAATGNVLDGGRLEDPTATSSNGGKWYAYPHIAVNAAGDFIIGFSQFSSSQRAAAGYSIHLAGDAAGTLRDPIIYKAGEDYYHKTFTTTTDRNRWGDFSKAQVDPSDDQSLWTLQEYAKARTGIDDGNTGTNSSRWGTYWGVVAGPPPTVTISAGSSQPEGNAGNTPVLLTVTLSTGYSLPVTVNFSTENGTATLADNDFSLPTGSVVIPPGNTSASITVNLVGDNKRESNETFGVRLNSATNGVIGGANLATLTIQNDDPVPSISIADVSLFEGDAGTTNFVFNVTLSNPTDQPASVQYQSANGSATLVDNDYQSASGTANFPANTTSANVTVLVNGDLTNEPNEDFFVNLTTPVQATILDNQGKGTIKNDDAPPTCTVTSPDGGEVLQEGSLRNLTWNATDEVAVTSVDLQLSRSGAGGPFENIALAQPNSGTYSWTITSPYTSNAYLKVTAHDAQGHATPDLSNAAWTITTPVGVPETPVTEFALAGIIPNPSKGQSDIYYDLPREAVVELTVSDLQGRTMATLVDGARPAGRHVASWKGTGANGPARTGLYFVRLRTPVGSFVRRLLITR